MSHYIILECMMPTEKCFVISLNYYYEVLLDNIVTNFLEVNICSRFNELKFIYQYNVRHLNV